VCWEFDMQSFVCFWRSQNKKIKKNCFKGHRFGGGFW
jgi:hypothetical protein